MDLNPLFSFSLFYCIYFIFRRIAFLAYKEASLRHCNDGKNWEDFSQEFNRKHIFLGFMVVQLSTLCDVWRELV